MVYSVTTRHALAMLAEMARARSAAPMPVRELAARAGVPSGYLSKIARTLVRHGILSSARGRGGGIGFAAQPQGIY